MSTDEALFITRLKGPEAAPLMAELKLYVHLPIPHATSYVCPTEKAIAGFLAMIYGASLENPVFADITDDDELESIREGWEKLVMMKVYDSVFGAIGTDEPKMQRHLNNKIAIFKWVQERHFDIPYSFEKSLEPAQAELEKVNAFRCPKDKVTILMNVLELALVVAIKQKQDSAGNDQLLPVLILIIIRSTATDIISNVNYILRFRGKQQVESGQVQYCLTTMMSAISFIYNMTLASLTLTKEEDDLYKTKLPAQYIMPTGSSSTTLPKPTGLQKPRGVAGSQSHASAFINNNNATTAISGFASQMFSNTIKALGDTATVLKGAAETVGGTVDGFTQDSKSSSEESPHSTSAPIDISNSKKPVDKTITPLRAGSPSSQTQAQPSPSTKAGTAFGKSLIASRQAALKLFTPGSSVLTAQSVFGGRASESEFPGVEKYVLEDYEMQLALALSLSEANGGAGVSGVTMEGGVPTGYLIDVENATQELGQVGLNKVEDDNEDEEIPLTSPRKKKAATSATVE
ncbi:hypothetical protein BCR33DRAFT_781942 [Rhizoclosmatium globosum]|uniref:VPS9 domain-containing protein n=1 Tax=Rhizoclosmatium globosum TaxID=329046 RepID=A0A1Y2CPF4_9FUNG|nr:hypothetical protein BCR33DRAFT_781942 [Rhizoclosmatium globosum]|eukprot:ORY48929.1 hypothetical protein BCR33DRAFT_781942 [Rhizoclosmatium globosum]